MIPNRAEIARIVDPDAFKLWNAQFEHCLRVGDCEIEARACADDAYKSDCDRALAKADAILAALAPQWRAIEGLRAAAREVLSFRIGTQPVQGWLVDRDASRSALTKLAAALVTAEEPSGEGEGA